VNVLLIDRKGYMLDFAMRCIRDGHAVRWFMERRDFLHIGKGCGAVFVNDWEPSMQSWADIAIMSDNVNYLARVDAWRGRDVPIIGACSETAAWELERTVGMDVFRKHGVPIADSKEFSNYDQAIAYVKKENRRFVSKPCGDEPDKSLSYVAKSPADMVYMLERWKKAKRHKGSFILQEFVAGVEMAVGAFFGPFGFNDAWCENWEEKKLMVGGLGPATGEQGTILRFVERSKLARKVLEPMEEVLIEMGYVGYVDVNCIIDESGTPWPLEWTMRFGWPTFNIQFALHHGDPVEWLYDLAKGRPSQPFSLNTVALGVVVAIPDYPYSRMTRKDVRGIPVYGLDDQPHFHPCELMRGSAPHDEAKKIVEKPCWTTAGDYLLVASGKGRTVKAAKERAYTNLKTLEVPNSPFWRTDIGDRLEKQIPQLQKHGFATGLAF
jgi:phosphoribosylamine--glycine ligase